MPTRLLASDVLADLDDDAQGRAAAFFPDFDHGYNYHVDARLSAYGDGSRWVIVIEQLAVNPRSGQVAGVSTNLYYHGNAITLPPQPVFNRNVVTNDGLSESDRYEARAALVPLCQTLAAFQEFDRKSFWHVNATRQLDTSVNADDSMASPDAVESAASGLGTMVSLYGHPGRFPVALRHDVADAAASMRGYLQVTQEAAKYEDPAERAQLRSSAEKRLTDSNAALQRLTSAVGLNMSASQVTGYAR